MSPPESIATPPLNTRRAVRRRKVSGGRHKAGHAAATGRLKGSDLDSAVFRPARDAWRIAASAQGHLAAHKSGAERDLGMLWLQQRQVVIVWRAGVVPGRA